MTLVSFGLSAAYNRTGGSSTRPTIAFQSRAQMLKFASRIRLVSETGESIRFIHAEEAERLFRAGQALRRESGKTVRELFLPDHRPQEGRSAQSDSRRSVYKETLDGGTELLMETQSESRPVVTRPCRAYKMKTIRRTLRPCYETVVQQALRCPSSDEECSPGSRASTPQSRPPTRR